MIRAGLTMTPQATRVAAPIHDELRLTIPVREALVGARNRVELVGVTTMLPHTLDPRGRGPAYQVWRVELVGDVPAGIVLCVIGHGSEQHRGLRMRDEPEFPGELVGGAPWWEQGDWIGCPSCRSPLVWYEAGYVPGYRVCAGSRHHHAQLARDGMSAKAFARE